MPNPQILNDQLTLNQPGSRLCQPHYFLPPPRIFRPSYGPATQKGSKQESKAEIICLPTKTTWLEIIRGGLSVINFS